MKVPQEHSAFGQAWNSSSCCMHFFAASSINLDRLSVISFDRAYSERLENFTSGMFQRA